jgi:hypothetical protein
LVPRPTLSSTNYCLANTSGPGIAYAVYYPKGRVADVDLTATNAVLRVEWFNPDTGNSEPAENISGGTRQTFRPPFDGLAVLLLRRAFGENRE